MTTASTWPAVLAALLDTADPPTNYALTPEDVRHVGECYDWNARWQESGWAPGTVEYDTLADMVRAEPSGFLADISRYYGDDHYMEDDEDEDEDEPEMRADWLCQCGNGAINVPVSEIPNTCPVCGHTTQIRDDDLDDYYDDHADAWDDYDDSMDGDHESALESVYGPND